MRVPLLLMLLSIQANAILNETERPLTDFVTTCKEMQAAIYVSKIDAKELEKIGKDFSTTYRLRNLRLFFRNPDKMRLEASSRIFGEALIIMDGTRRFYAVSKLNLRRIENLEKEPAKRQSLLEYGGQISAQTLDFMEGKFLKQENIGTTSTLCYSLKYRGQTANSYYHIWIDPQTKITLKRVWYDPQNKIKATFLYAEQKEIAPNFWMPGKCEIQNGEGITAAILDFKDIKTGMPLEDSLFEIKP
jgi:outer membrane lipoprotein-sorting protein